MKRNNLWRWLFVIFVTAWSLYEIYPPNDQPLLPHFQEKAVGRDATFSNIVAQAAVLNEETPTRTFAHIQTAAGTNSLAPYFPQYEVPVGIDTNVFILGRLQREVAGNIKLGIDLRGGTEFLLGMDSSSLPSATDAVEAAYENQARLSQAVEVLRKRVDRLGVAEPLLQPVGDDRILIQLPGLTDEEMDAARRQIEQAAFLEFRLVHPESDELLSRGITVVPGHELLTSTSQTPTGETRTERVLVERKRASVDGVELTGNRVANARFVRDQIGQPEIELRFDATGASLFREITTANVGRRLAIVLDGELASAPVIRTEITGGIASISGSYTEKEAQELANVLNNPLETPVKVLSENRVGPTLGADSVASGIRAGIVGLLAVCVFMVIYYMICGVIANVALLLNMIILLGVLCNIDATLTLPGIAGIVLTIGMAVDANVLIYERIREEFAAGKSLRGAVNSGYDKAFSTIFDANITTLIASVILIFLGTGQIKGFGVTLTIGLCVSMFTALVVTRILFDFLIDRNLIKSLPMLHFVKAEGIDFLKFARPAFIASWILIVIGVGYGIQRGGNAVGHDFKGGSRITLSFNQDQRIDQGDLSAAISAAVQGEPLIQYQRDLGGDETLSVTAPLAEDESGEAVSVAREIETALRDAFPDSNYTLAGENTVGATVGAEILQSAFLSVGLALLGILIYVAIRYEFSFAVGAVVATIHDVLMTIGWFFLAGGVLSAPMVAALLTIIGFSINDTIVIFDRIREDIKLGVKGSFRDIINIAINQTLSRTIITSGTTLVSALALYLFAGGVITDLAFTFLVGVITGTYSTIYIACFVVLKWNKGQRPKLFEEPTNVSATAESSLA